MSAGKKEKYDRLPILRREEVESTSVLSDIPRLSFPWTITRSCLFAVLLGLPCFMFIVSESYAALINHANIKGSGRSLGSYVFQTWQNQFPCIDPRSTPDDGHPIGLYYVKMFKAASSTLAGVAMLIADRHKLPNMTADDDRCAVHAHHSPAETLNLPKRDLNRSYLWSFIRDPKTRSISSYFYFKVLHKGQDPYSASYPDFLKSQNNQQVNYLRTRDESEYNMTDAIATAAAILHEYNFIGLVERLDESLVLMRLLLGLDAKDVLYLSSKRSGTYDGQALGNGVHICNRIPSKFTTPEVDEYLDSKNWRDRNAIDYALYDAVEKAHEATIDAIGRDIFTAALREHRELLELVDIQCGNVAKYPCTNEGVHQQSNCYWKDIGCGHECIQSIRP